MSSSEQRLAANSEIESMEVSYAVLNLDQRENMEELLQKVAATINVQLTFERNALAFIPFNNFERASHEDKVLLYGRSGCGKSRAIFEITKDQIASFNRIYIINPRSPGSEVPSARINLFSLAQKFGPEDLVLWDNFPDDLVKRDLETAIKVLQTISTRNVKKMIVALKPRYLEMYSVLYRNIRKTAPEFTPHEVRFDGDKFEQILKSYGATVKRFTKLYEDQIVRNTQLVSKILWQKDPIPITILAYYKELVRQQESLHPDAGKDNSAVGYDNYAIIEARKLLPATDYYENQFQVLAESEEKLSDRDFLYILKLCYELGINRTDEVINYLQSRIFKTTAPRQPSKNLSTWIYLSGRYYSMHDAIREAIKLDDTAKKEIMNYLAYNFLEKDFTDTIGADGHIIHQLAIFFGKNIQFMPNENNGENSFLPSHLNEYVAKDLHFALGLGLGAGESWKDLDDEHLRQVILEKTETPDGIEFTRGLGNSLGHNFQLLNDKHDRSKILNATYSGLPFARYLGESLGGGPFKDFSRELQDEIFELTTKNNQFADGLGVGLARVYNSLPSELRQKIVSIAEKNSELTRGLGTGFGETFSLLDKTFQEDIFDKAKKNSEFAFGLGCGFGRVFNRFDLSLQKRIYELMENDGQLSYGFGIYSTLTNYLQYNVILSLPADQKEQEKAKMFKMAQRNSRFALGMGIGVGFSLSYLSDNDKAELFDLAEKNSEFARGIGNGFGLIFKQVRKLRVVLYEIANRNIEFARGLGIGVGFTILYLDEELRNEVLAKAEDDSGFAYGLGYGLGYVFAYLKQEDKLSILGLANKNPEFARGFGFGLGYILPYLQQELQQLAYELSGNNKDFAGGLGFGIGMIFKHLPADDKSKYLTMADNNGEFAHGLGTNLGRLFQYFSYGERTEFTLKTEKNARFAEGLGEGIGFIFPHLEEGGQKDGGHPQHEQILNFAQQNTELAKGLGAGYGRAFRYLPADLKSKFAKMEKENVKFAEGLGEGLGHSYMHLDEYRPPQKLDVIIEMLKQGYSLKSLDRPLQQLVATKAERGNESGFTRGFGTGLGRIFKHLPRGFQEKLFQKAKQNSQFANGLGTGLGRIFQYLSEAQKKEVFANAQGNNQLSRGLGFGLGSSFKYLDEKFQQRILASILEKTNKLQEESHNDSTNDAITGSTRADFARGLGAGFASTFQYLTGEFQKEVFAIAEKNNDFSFGLGSGFADSFAFLEEKLQIRETIFVQAGHNALLATGLGFGLGHTFEFLSIQLQSMVLLEAKTNSALAQGLGNGFGHIFHRLNSRFQENIMEIAESNSDFTKGLSDGLGLDFKYLDPTLQNKLLGWAQQRSTLTRRMGEGIGRNFLSLNSELRMKIFKLASETDNEFISGLSDGLEYSYRYLGKELQDGIIQISKRNPSFAKKVWGDNLVS